MHRRYTKSGFTIVELLIVVVVIAILAGLVAVAYGSIVNNAKRAAAESHLKDLVKKIEITAINNGGSLPANAGGIDGFTDDDDYTLSGEDYCISHTSGDLVWHVTRLDQSLREGGCTVSANPDPGYAVAAESCFAHSGNTITAYVYDGSTCPAILTIPGTLGGDTITTIGSGAFGGQPIQQVAIASSITTIAPSAFPAISGLTDVYIPDGSVQTIGAAAFVSTGLTSLYIPDSVTTIGDFAFQDTSISTLRLSQNVTTIGMSAFLWAPLTGELFIPDSITSIGGSAFNNTTISSLTVGSSGYSGPSSFTLGGDCQFCGTSNLQTVTFNGIVDTISGGTFESGNNIQQVRVREGVRVIGDGAFDDINTITSIEIAGSVELIDDLAFNNLANLTSVTLSNSATLLTIDDNAFANNPLLTSITIPERTTYIGSGAFYMSGLTSLTIAGGSTALDIATNAFANNNLASVSIPGRVTSLGSSAFANNTNLSALTLNSGLLTLGNTAFESSNLGGTITIPSSVTTIEGGIFWGTPNNLTVNVPSSATVDPNAFDGVSTVNYY